MKSVCFAVLVVCLFATYARAASDTVAPLLSPKRLSLASGLNYEWRTTPFARSEAVEGRHAEWVVGVHGAYNVTPHASFVASTSLGLDSRQFRHSVGVRIRFWQGSK
jgi:hypothetical protein